MGRYGGITCARPNLSRQPLGRTETADRRVFSWDTKQWSNHLGGTLYSLIRLDIQFQILLYVENSGNRNTVAYKKPSSDPPRSPLTENWLNGRLTLPG